MKLLLFISSLEGGGAERVTANLARYWAEKGWQITVVTFTCADTDFFRLPSSVHRVELGLIGGKKNLIGWIDNNLRRIFSLRRVLRKLRPDAALAMMNTNNIILSFAARGVSDLVVVGSERTYPPRVPLGFFLEWLRSWSYGSLSGLVAQTAKSAEWLQQHCRIQRMETIPNALTWPLSTQEPVVELPPQLKGRKVLLAVGRLSGEKCFDSLIATFSQIARDYPDWILVILGEGPERVALERQISNTSLPDRIMLPGQVGNIGQWYEASDLYVMSSRFEGFPNSLLEAMACGLAVVSFDCDTGPRDIIRHNIDGVLVTPGDFQDLRTALVRLMRDGVLRQEYGDEAKNVIERFSVEVIAERWEKLFLEIRG